MAPAGVGDVADLEGEVSVIKYETFLSGKRQLTGDGGFAPVWMPDFLYGFQAHLVEWAVHKGRAAIFADCGLGKSPMQLVWAENVIRKTNRPVLIATPLAVSYQLLREAEKFGIEAVRSVDGVLPRSPRVVVTNYERLEHFDPADFAGMVCDESSILKNFSGVRRKQVTEFMRGLPYRLLCTATAAPNDYTELGTSSEALGVMDYAVVLSRFFTHDSGETAKWRLKGHARSRLFWRWVCSWARAIRAPSDLGFEDNGFRLPPLTEREHIVAPRSLPDGYLFPVVAVGLTEQREERRRTLHERCERVASLVQQNGNKSLVWCHLNAEGDLLAEMIANGQQVKGSDSDERKEETLLDFATGDLPVLITKPKIGAWGLNLQRCAHITFFPSHSYEQYYQGVRRCWRFGQEREVVVDLIATEGEAAVMRNLEHKRRQADAMFTELVQHMRDDGLSESPERFERHQEIPKWL